MQLPKLVVFDVDGTLIDWDGVVSDHTHRVLRQLRAAGVPIALATGRPLAIAEQTLEHVGGADWIACGNGSALVEVAGWNMLRDRSLPQELIAPVVTTMREWLPGIGTAIEVADLVIEERGFSRRVPEELMIEPVRDALAALQAHGGAARRLIFFHDQFDERLDELALLVEGTVDHRCQVQFGGLPIVDVSPYGDHKAIALQELVDHLGIDAADVIAFGDGSNDVEMLEWAGIGVAMGNARDVLKDVADEVTDDVDQRGISAFLDPLLAPYL